MTTHRSPAFAYATFPPAAAEQVSGVSVTLQRDWRRRKILHPGNDRDASGFTLFAVAELMLLKTLSNHGFDPKRVYGWTAALAAAVTAAALNDPMAWATPEAWAAYQAQGEPSALSLGRYAVICSPPHGVVRIDDPLPLIGVRGLATVLDLVLLGELLRGRAARALGALNGWTEGVETDAAGQRAGAERATEAA